MLAASNQQVANNTSRQMIPTKTNAGGISARNGSNSATRFARAASANEARPKPSQYEVAISRNMLPGPGAIGSITPHSHGHDRRLPVAANALGDVLIDKLGIVGHDAGIEDPQRQGVAGSEQRGDEPSRSRRAEPLRSGCDGIDVPGIGRLRQLHQPAGDVAGVEPVARQASGFPQARH